MAEGSYCVSKFFCHSIAEFLNTTDAPKMTNSRSSSPIYCSKYCRATLSHPLPCPPISSTLCLPDPSNAHELQRLKDNNRNKNTEVPTTWRGGLRHGVALQCHYVRQGLVSWTWFCKISLLTWRRRMRQTRTRVPSDHASCTGQFLSEQ